MNKKGFTQGIWYAVIIFLTVLAIIVLLIFGGALRDKMKEYIEMLMNFLRL